MSPPPIKQKAMPPTPSAFPVMWPCRRVLPLGGRGTMRFWWLALATASRAATRKWMPLSTVQRGGGGGVFYKGLCVLPLNAIRHWGACNDDWLDNAWLCMRNHASRWTRAGGSKGRGEEREGDDDARSHRGWGGGSVGEEPQPR